MSIHLFPDCDCCNSSNCVCKGTLPLSLSVHFTVTSSGSGAFADDGIIYPTSPTGTIYLTQTLGTIWYWQTDTSGLSPRYYILCDNSFVGGQWRFCVDEDIGDLPRCVIIPGPDHCCPSFGWDTFPIAITTPSGSWSGTWQIDSVDAVCGDGYYCVQVIDYPPGDSSASPTLEPPECVYFASPPDPALYSVLSGPYATAGGCRSGCGLSSSSPGMGMAVRTGPRPIKRPRLPRPKPCGCRKPKLDPKN